jgi:ATP-binding cassette, subfamily B, bacterial MsbA
MRAENKPASMTASLPLIKRLSREYVFGYWRMLAAATAMMIVAAASTGGMAKLMEPIIDNVFTARDATMLWPVAIAVFTVFALRGASTYGHTVLMNKLGQRIVSDMNRDMFGHLIYADIAYFHGQPSGQLQSRFISDMALIRTAITETLMGIGKNSFSIAILVGVMFWQDWKLSVLSLFVFPAAAYFVARLGRKLRRVSTSTQMAVGELANILGQAFRGSKHIKACGMEEFEKNRVGAIIENIFRLTTRSFRVSAITAPVAEVLSGFAIVTIIVYGGQQVIEGESTAGKLFSFITAFLLAFEPMKRLAKLSNIMQMGLAATDRFYRMLDIAPAIGDKPGAVELKTVRPCISFDNASFAYQDGAEALKGVTFEAPAGKMVALVGESGAGKSTILNLIPRFYDVSSGAIRIDGTDIRDMTLESLRRSMAFVSQDVAIFNDTIADNIAYGSPGATRAQIEEAARRAAAHDFILELKDGYDTIVGENGVKLSGGQRQRISIARAMLRNAPILLLDEATSALDANSERLVQQALERLQEGRTTIVVAHRLSTIIGADIIYVMDGGKIIESGNHVSLMAKNGAYARLYGTLMRETA